MVASALFAYFAGNLSADDFLDWGWRYPFFVAFAINVVALFARLRMVVTPEYPAAVRDRANSSRRRIGETVARRRPQHRDRRVRAARELRAVPHGHGVPAVLGVPVHRTRARRAFSSSRSIGAVVGVVAIVASGHDRRSRRPAKSLLVRSAVAIAAFSGFAPQLLNGGDVGEAIFMVLGFVLLGLSFGQSSGAVASNFSKAIATRPRR